VRALRVSSTVTDMRGATLAGRDTGSVEPSCCNEASCAVVAGRTVVVSVISSYQLIFLRKRYRIQIATPFISKVMPSRIAPAAAAFAWNSGSGRDTQLNIWIGIAVKGSLSQSKEMKGNSPWI